MSKKRPREETEALTDLDDSSVADPENAKRICKDDPIHRDLQQKETHQYEVLKNVEIDKKVNWNVLWKFCLSFLSLNDLRSLRQVCRLFRDRSGSSFLRIERLKLFSSTEVSIDLYAQYSSIIESSRKIVPKICSIQSDSWNSWVVPCELDDISLFSNTFNKSNISSLYLNSQILLNGNAVVDHFPRLNAIVIDTFFALLKFKTQDFPTTKELSIINRRDNVSMLNIFQQLRNTGALNDTCFSQVAEFDPALLLQHASHLFENSLPQLEKLTLFGITSHEIEQLLRALCNKYIQQNQLFQNIPNPFSKLTVLRLSIGLRNQITTPNYTLIPSIITCIDGLQELWVDNTIPFFTHDESFDLKNLQVLQISICKNPPICPVLSGKNLKSAYLTFLGSSGAILEAPELERLSVSSGPLSLSMLLSAFTSTKECPMLKHLKINCFMSQQEYVSDLVVEKFHHLEELLVNVSSTAASSLPLSININCQKLKNLFIKLLPSISLSQLNLDQSMNQLECLMGYHLTSPRACCQSPVLVPHIPLSVKKITIPAHWRFINGKSPISLNSFEDSIDIQTFNFEYAMDFHPRLRLLSLNLLYDSPTFFNQFCKVLPEMKSLEELNLTLLAPNCAPAFNSFAIIHKLKSESLVSLKLSKVTHIYAKPAINQLNNVGGQRNPASISTELLLARANCTQCSCSGYTTNYQKDLSQTPNTFKCSTPLCGHGALEHRAVEQTDYCWLCVSLVCPRLRQLSIAGGCSIQDIPSFIRKCPLLEELTVTNFESMAIVTLAHPTVRYLRIQRLNGLRALYLKLPDLVKLTLDNCQHLKEVTPMLTPKLEQVSIALSPLSAPSEERLKMANQKGTVQIKKSAERPGQQS